MLVVFGGSKDVAFNREISDLAGTVRIPRRTHQTGRGTSISTAGEDVPVLRPEEIRELPERTALVIADNARPILAHLDRCVDKRPGKTLLAVQANLRRHLAQVADAGPLPLAARHSASSPRSIDD